jgi:hypothetical protein
MDDEKELELMFWFHFGLKFIIFHISIGFFVKFLTRFRYFILS